MVCWVGLKMADLKMLKGVRGTTWARVSRLIASYKGVLQENYGYQTDKLMAILQSLKDKQNYLKKIDRDIVELLSKDKLESKGTQSYKTNMNIRLGIQKISKKVESKKAKDK